MIRAPHLFRIGRYHQSIRPLKDEDFAPIDVEATQRRTEPVISCPLRKFVVERRK